MEGRDAYKVRQEKSGIAAYHYYDVATGLKVKSVVSAQGQTTEAVLADYQKTAYGILYPMTQKVTMPQIGLVEAKVTKVEFNTGITPDQL